MSHVNRSLINESIAVLPRCVWWRQYVDCTNSWSLWRGLLMKQSLGLGLQNILAICSFKKLSHEAENFYCSFWNPYFASWLLPMPESSEKHSTSCFKIVFFGLQPAV